MKGKGDKARQADSKPKKGNQSRGGGELKKIKLKLNHKIYLHHRM